MFDVKQNTNINITANIIDTMLDKQNFYNRDQEKCQQTHSVAYAIRICCP